MHAAFSLEAWNRNVHVYEIIRSMPFNAALAAGTLSEARFKHYITQDAHYLLDRHAVENELAFAHLAALLEVPPKLFSSVHASTRDQPLYAVENEISYLVLAEERLGVGGSVAIDERHAIRVHREPGARFGRVVHDDEVELFGHQLSTPVLERRVGFQREPYRDQRVRSRAYGRRENVRR